MPADLPPSPEAGATRAGRRRQAALAGHQGDAETARRLFADPDPSVAATALGALARLREVTVDDLRQAIADPRPELRQRAAEELAAFGALATTTGEAPTVDPAEVSLLPLLSDAEPTVIEVAAWACGECLPPQPGVVERLVELTLTHEDALVREAAVAALGAIGDPAGLPAILAATDDKATVRRRAVLALAPFDGQAVDAALEKATKDRDWQVRQAAEDLLAPE